MRIILLLSLLLLTFSTTFAQVISVSNKETNQPVADVFIYNSTQSQAAQTNAHGVADLYAFDDSDSLYFQHPSYQAELLTKAQLAAIDFKLALIPSTFQINEVVISANKWAENSRDVTQHLQTIDRKDIEFQNPQTSADLLDASGEVYVQKSQQGGGSPMLRGFAANAVLLVMDGVRMNNAIYRSGNLQNVIAIDPHALKRSEVVFGPGSVIYGSDAMGGVMHFHTIEPDFSNSKSFKFNGTASARYASANHEKTVHTHLTYANNLFAGVSSFSLSDFGDLRSGANHPEKYPDFGQKPYYVERMNGQDSVLLNPNPHIQRHSGYRQWNFMQKLKYKPSETVELSYALHLTSSSDIPRYDRLTELKDGAPKYAAWYYGPQEWQLHQLEADILQPTPLFDQAKLMVSRQDVKESRHNRKLDNPLLRSQTEQVGIWGMHADFEKAVNKNAQIYYGLETYYNSVTSVANYQNIETLEYSPAETRYPSGGSNYQSYAAYVSTKNQLSENLVLNSGIRYNLILLNAREKSAQEGQFTLEPFSHQNSAFSGSLGLAWHLENDWQIKPAVSTAFRAPNIDDAGKLFSPTAGIITVPNPDLKPEYAYNFEMNITKRWKNRSHWYFSGYYTLLEDVMVRRPFVVDGKDFLVIQGDSLETRALVNSGKGRIYGISTGLKWQFSPVWKFNGTINWTEGHDQDGFALRHVPPVYGRTALAYDRDKWQAEFSVQFNGAKPFEKLAPEEQEKTHAYTPEGALAWYTFNLKASYQPYQWLTVQSGIENILDFHYRPFASGISAAGRNVYFSIQTTF